MVNAYDKNVTNSAIDEICLFNQITTRPPATTYGLATAIFTGFLYRPLKSLRLSYAPLPTVPLVDFRANRMDIIYLLLLILLIGSTAAFLRLCVRLEERK